MLKFSNILFMNTPDSQGASPVLEPRSAPQRWHRLVAAVLLGALAVAVFLIYTAYGPSYMRGTAADLGGPIEGARRILNGEHNIYARPYALYDVTYSLMYPLTASFLVLPLAPLPLPVAGAVFVGLTTAIAAFFLSRNRWDDLLLFASAPAFFSWALAQWSPLLLIQGLVPWTVAIGLCKPSVGVVMFAYRPAWKGVLPALLFLLVTLAWSPTWPYDWLHGALTAAGTAVGEVDEHAGALFAPGGVLLLAAAWRWRDPAARLLLALTVIPNRMWFYDQLYLGLIPQTLYRRLAWIACTWVAAAGWEVARMITASEARFTLELLLVTLVYGPALIFVLRPPAKMPDNIRHY